MKSLLGVSLVRVVFISNGKIGIETTAKDDLHQVDVSYSQLSALFMFFLQKAIKYIKVNLILSILCFNLKGMGETELQENSQILHKMNGFKFVNQLVE